MSWYLFGNHLFTMFVKYFIFMPPFKKFQEITVNRYTCHNYPFSFLLFFSYMRDNLCYFCFALLCIMLKKVENAFEEGCISHRIIIKRSNHIDREGKIFWQSFVHHKCIHSSEAKTYEENLSGMAASGLNLEIALLWDSSRENLPSELRD